MTLTEKDVSAYLKRKKLVQRGESIYSVNRIGSDLKNLVYRVTTSEQEFMVKQAHSRVQLKERWWLDRKRIFHEKNCIEALSEILPPDVLPDVILEDRTDFILVTTAPPRDSVLWESDLLRGRIDLQLAVQCGELLATVHNQTADVRELKSIFKDTKPFEQLRIEPLYGHIAQAYPDLKKPIEMQARRLLKDRFCLILGDLRPRNVWIQNGQVYLVDFATAHFGSPSFDLAFYASDLCLKAMLNSPQKAAYLEAINVFWNSYFKVAEHIKREDTERHAVHNFGCLLLSSTDGRQPADFFDEHMQDLVRRISQSLLFTELERIEEITEFINRTLIDG
jgi:5-methylthioribose kinase